MNEVNYLQVRASWFRQFAQKVASQIPNAPSFPPDLGLIGIPYSQSSAVFLNALIPHEMGHFVYQRLNMANALLPDIDNCINSALGKQDEHRIERRWCVDKLSSWAEEVFCDLFAVWVVGPAYAFAYVELLDLANIVSVAALPSGPKEHLEFGLRHPANALRLAEHVTFLKQLGWWSHVSSMRSHYVDALKYVEVIPRTDYRFSAESPSLAALTLMAFFRLIPSIKNGIGKLVNNLDAGASDYARFKTSVQDYLHSGVVPSTVVTKLKGKKPNHRFDHPHPISVLNVAYKIHLESIDSLLIRVGMFRLVLLVIEVSGQRDWSFGRQKRLRTTRCLARVFKA